MFELLKLGPFRCSESAVLPSGRESVGAVSVFEFVVDGLPDQALPFLPRISFRLVTSQVRVVFSLTPAPAARSVGCGFLPQRRSSATRLRRAHRRSRLPNTGCPSPFTTTPTAFTTTVKIPGLVLPNSPKPAPWPDCSMKAWPKYVPQCTNRPAPRAPNRNQSSRVLVERR